MLTRVPTTTTAIIPVSATSLVGILLKAAMPANAWQQWKHVSPNMIRSYLLDRKRKKQSHSDERKAIKFSNRKLGMRQPTNEIFQRQSQYFREFYSVLLRPVGIHAGCCYAGALLVHLPLSFELELSPRHQHQPAAAWQWSRTVCRFWMFYSGFSFGFYFGARSVKQSVENICEALPVSSRWQLCGAGSCCRCTFSWKTKFADSFYRRKQTWIV